MKVRSIEFWLGGGALLLLTLVPVVEFVLGLFETSLPGAHAYGVHLVLLVAFLAGMITTERREHLSLTSGLEEASGRIGLFYRTHFSWVGEGVGGVVCLLYCIGSFSFLLIGIDPEGKVGFLPTRLFVAILPVGFGVMAIRFFGHMIRRVRRLLGIVAILVGILVGFVLTLPTLLNIVQFFSWEVSPFWEEARELFFVLASKGRWIGVLFFLFCSLLGLPIFTVLGGVTFSFLMGGEGFLEVLPNEAYTLLTRDSLPAIPLFTLTGFILSESRSGERLIRFFDSLLGRIPGGIAIVVVVVSAFFTTFTGASGVTILALGGVLSFMMIKNGHYSEKFTHGLLTSSGSVGLLFPPSLPIIMYGVMAKISIKDLFVGGIVPGLLLIASLASAGIIYSVRQGKGSLKGRSPKREKALPAFKEAIGEFLLPPLLLIGYFGGFTSLVETAALTVFYVLFIEMVIRRDITLAQLKGVFEKSLPIIGGILLLLAMAKGLSFYIIDASIPQQLTQYIEDHIQSRYLFLVILNLLLLMTGAIMDIYSAILVVGPLIIPAAAVFDIHPVHLGIIFLANLELGFLTPPVGLQLFLASYRFKIPLFTACKRVFPFFLLMLVVVLAITYIPWMSIGFLS